MTTSNFSQENLNSMKLKDLRDILDTYNLPISGKKDVLTSRIIDHQNKIKREKEDWDNLMTKGSVIRDDDFEKVIKCFTTWCNQNGFYISKLKTSYTYEDVHINEVRAAFVDYKPELSSIRKDKLVPKLNNKMDIFLEMFFQEYLDSLWFFMDKTDEERIFEDSSEFNDEWFGRGMKKLYQTI